MGQWAWKGDIGELDLSSLTQMGHQSLHVLHVWLLRTQ